MNPVSILSDLLARSGSATAFSDASIAVLALAVVASSRSFYVLPGVDLSVSRWFYDAAEGLNFTTSAGRA
jgi:hypothetical protein